MFDIRALILYKCTIILWKEHAKIIVENIVFFIRMKTELMVNL